jgi:hypothetical protein
VVVVVDDVCAKAVLAATAHAAPAANNFINLLCFMFILCIGYADVIRRISIRLVPGEVYSTSLLFRGSRICRSHRYLALCNLYPDSAISCRAIAPRGTIFLRPGAK